jgi:hypothetical protein
MFRRLLGTYVAPCILYFNSYGGFNDYGSGGDGGAIAGILFLALALSVVLFYVAVRWAWTVMKAMGQESEGKPAFWICVGLWVLSLLGVLGAASTGTVGKSVTQGTALAVTIVLFLLFSGFLFMVARVVNGESQQLFSQPKEKLASAVLRHSWWPPMNELR